MKCLAGLSAFAIACGVKASPDSTVMDALRVAAEEMPVDSICSGRCTKLLLDPVVLGLDRIVLRRHFQSPDTLLVLRDATFGGRLARLSPALGIPDRPIVGRDTAAIEFYAVPTRDRITILGYLQLPEDWAQMIRVDLRWANQKWVIDSIRAYES